ncbi:hypothetical protein [Pseudobacteroides cellulosolvens]|uniref:DoxX family protein n=1 Tax=Pseudobacteroides cellulosolvens ATCC 35603 = DSM 2933 TaxID=398512 RepID=A0A0L6JP79_9FIRM|nr:hypothetical protein [Pseudobacteroides cellulosolvens]KNY27588.1 hypothetical protein Bccel_2859 [Pseudobacteroides cellulosolvens ATCC 35603 = DSM 2933]
MKKERPAGVTLIGCFYIFGAVVLLLTLGIKQDFEFNIRFGIPGVPEIIVRLSIIMLSLIMAYGYLKLEKWGYWIMILYSIVFLMISLNQVSVYKSQPFIGNVIFSLIVIIYTFTKRKCFVKKPMEISAI